MFSRRLPTLLLVVALALAIAAPVGAAPRAGVSVDDARAAAEAARSELNAAAARIDDARATYYELENEIDSLQSDLDALEAQAADLRVVARRRAVDAYVGESVSFTDALESDDVLDVARKTVLLDQVKAQDDDKIEDLKAINEDLERKRGELENKRGEAKSALDRVNAEIADYQARYDEAQGVLAQAEEQARLAEERRQREAAARAAEAAARASRAEQEAAQATTTSTASAPSTSAAPSGPTGNLGGTPGANGLICPLPAHGGFSDSYGDARSGHSHQGVDIPGPYGAAVVAVISGTVSFQDMGGGGMGAVLNGSDGNIYRYMHLSGYAKGGAVSQGDVIGYNGHSGNANGFDHLHWERWPGGAGPANPYPYAAAVC